MSAKIELNYDKLDALLQFKVSLRFCADYLGVSSDTIMRRLKEDHGMSFTEYHESRMERTAVKLQQKAIEMALTGKNTTMMIFALKNLAKWTDKVEETVKQELTVIPAFEIVDYEDDTDKDTPVQEAEEVFSSQR